MDDAEDELFDEYDNGAMVGNVKFNSAKDMESITPIHGEKPVENPNSVEAGLQNNDHQGVCQHDIETETNETESNDTISVENEVSFQEWLHCYYPYNYDTFECGDISGKYYDCYLDKFGCDNEADKYLLDCFWHNENCEIFNGCSTYRCINADEVAIQN